MSHYYQYANHNNQIHHTFDTYKNKSYYTSTEQLTRQSKTYYDSDNVDGQKRIICVLDNRRHSYVYHTEPPV